MDSVLKAIPEETYVPIRVIVYETLREAIFRRELKDGEKLVESDLAEKLKVSRTPIREALRMLESEGLVERIPRKGLFVKGLSKEDIIEIYSIRQALEAVAIRAVCKNITDEELAELKKLYAQMEDAYEKGDDNKLSILSQKFNEAIVAPSNMPRLLSLITTYHEYLSRLRSLSFSRSLRKVQALKEHGQILEAVSERDADRAERLVKEHLENAIKALTIEFPQAKAEPSNNH